MSSDGLDPALIRDAINAGLDLAVTRREAFKSFANYLLIWVGRRALVELEVDGQLFSSLARFDSAPEVLLDSRTGNGFSLRIKVEEILSDMGRVEALFPESSVWLVEIVERIRSLSMDRSQGSHMGHELTPVPSGDWWLKSLRPLQANLQRALDPFATSSLCNKWKPDERRLQLWCVFRHFWQGSERKLAGGSTYHYTASLLPTAHQLEALASDNNLSLDQVSEIISTPVGGQSRSTADTVLQSGHLLIGQPSGVLSAPDDRGPDLDKDDFRRRNLEYDFYIAHCGFTRDSRIAYFPALETYGLRADDRPQPIFALYFFLNDTDPKTCLDCPDTRYIPYRFWRDMVPTIGERLRAAYEDAYITVVIQIILDRYKDLQRLGVIDEVNSKLELLTRIYALPKVALTIGDNGKLVPVLSPNDYYQCASNLGHMKPYYHRLSTLVEKTLERANVIATDATLNGQLALSHTVYNIVALSQYTSLGRSINELPASYIEIKNEFSRSEAFFELLSGCASLSEGIAAPDNNSKYVSTTPYSLLACLSRARAAVELKHPGFKLDLAINGGDILVPAGFIKDKATSSVLFEILENVIQEAHFNGQTVPVSIELSQHNLKISVCIKNASKHGGTYCLSSSGIWVPKEHGENQRLSYLRRMKIAGPKVGIELDTDFNEDTRTYSTIITLQRAGTHIKL